MPNFRQLCHLVRRGAGKWRGLEVAIKTVLFQSGDRDSIAHRIASEAAIASNLTHENVVATYAHDVRAVADGGAAGAGPGPGSGAAAAGELAIFKFYLVQVRLFFLKLLAEQLCFCLVQNHHTTEFKYNQSKIDKLTSSRRAAHTATLPNPQQASAQSRRGGDHCRSARLFWWRQSMTCVRRQPVTMVSDKKVSCRTYGATQRGCITASLCAERDISPTRAWS
jgi:hypothetical protein